MPEVRELAGGEEGKASPTILMAAGTACPSVILDGKLPVCSAACAALTTSPGHRHAVVPRAARRFSNRVVQVKNERRKSEMKNKYENGQDSYTRHTPSPSPLPD